MRARCLQTISDALGTDDLLALTAEIERRAARPADTSH